MSRGYSFFYQGEFVTNSAGVRAVYALSDLLRSKGFKVEFYNKPSDRVDRNSIAVYTDNVSGNPLGLSRVARWYLFYPNYFDDSVLYGENEVNFTWLPRFIELPADRVLQVNVIEPCFNDVGITKPRHRRLAYIGKGAFKGVEYPPKKMDPKGCVFIRPHFPPTRRELAVFLREASVLYTFDEDTMLTFEALLCGCPVVLLSPDGKEVRPLTLSDIEITRDPKAINDMVDNFIRITQQSFA